MTTKEKIVNSLSSVVDSSKYVSINDNKVKELARDLLDVTIPDWDNDSQLYSSPEETAFYYFFLDSINFCFWGPKQKERWEYKIKDKWTGGYYAFSSAIKEAFLRDKRFFDAEYLSNISEEDFKAIFSEGRNELFLMKERYDIIRENFTILKQEFAGKATNLLLQTKNNADQLVELLIARFPSFRDIYDYQDHKLYFLKRAQIFASDMSFSGVESLKMSNLKNLAIFADYKLPQILESVGVLQYSSNLNEEIENQVLIPVGSLKEIEIRANSIFAVEKIREELKVLGREITSQELDWILWAQAKKTKFQKPHHRTLTTFY